MLVQSHSFTVQVLVLSPSKLCLGVGSVQVLSLSGCWFFPNPISTQALALTLSHHCPSPITCQVFVQMFYPYSWLSTHTLGSCSFPILHFFGANPSTSGSVPVSMLPMWWLCTHISMVGADCVPIYTLLASSQRVSRLWCWLPFNLHCFPSSSVPIPSASWFQFCTNTFSLLVSVLPQSLQFSGSRFSPSSSLPLFQLHRNAFILLVLVLSQPLETLCVASVLILS